MSTIKTVVFSKPGPIVSRANKKNPGQYQMAHGPVLARSPQVGDP